MSDDAKPAHVHAFDRVSGYCRCGYREDGRLIGPGGQIFQPGREYTAQELDEIRERASA